MLRLKAKAKHEDMESTEQLIRTLRKESLQTLLQPYRLCHCLLLRFWYSTLTASTAAACPLPRAMRTGQDQAVSKKPDLKCAIWMMIENVTLNGQ